VTLVLLLVLGSPGSVALSAAARVQVEGCGLAVATEPAGAAVYLNGELRGETPLALEGLPEGDHRVRVVKDGYLENSRVVSLRSGDAQAVRVKLTPASQPRASATQVEAPPAPQAQPKKKGGGGGKILLIGLGVAAVGAGVFFLLPKNDPPVAALTIDAGGTVALQGATNVSFDGSGSRDPNNDPLTYSWDFGDGSTGTGQRTTHVYNTAGAFNVTLTVSDGKKSATATGTVTVRNLTGTWTGDLSDLNRGVFFTWNLTQSGSSVSGTYSDFVNGSGTATGRVSAARSVAFTTNLTGFRPGSWTGTLNSDGTRIEGTVDWFVGGVRSFYLNRR
jgi:PKD repeat protein